MPPPETRKKSSRGASKGSTHLVDPREGTSATPVHSLGLRASIMASTSGPKFFWPEWSSLPTSSRRIFYPTSLTINGVNFNFFFKNHYINKAIPNTVLTFTTRIKATRSRNMPTFVAKLVQRKNLWWLHPRESIVFTINDNFLLTSCNFY